MSRCLRTVVMVTIALLGLINSTARADFIEIIEPDEQPLWEELVGEFTTITFEELPQFTIVNDQYEDLGITFGGDINSVIFGSSYPNDGVGLDGNTQVRLTFEMPITAFAMHFPGGTDVAYFRDGEQIPGGGPFGGSGSGFFYGFVSTVPFDEVLLFDAFGGQVFVDDLYFGPPIPAPGAAAPLLLTGMLRRRRRRC